MEKPLNTFGYVHGVVVLIKNFIIDYRIFCSPVVSAEVIKPSSQAKILQ